MVFRWPLARAEEETQLFWLNFYNLININGQHSVLIYCKPVWSCFQLQQKWGNLNSRKRNAFLCIRSILNTKTWWWGRGERSSKVRTFERDYSFHFHFLLRWNNLSPQRLYRVPRRTPWSWPAGSQLFCEEEAQQWGWRARAQEEENAMKFNKHFLGHSVVISLEVSS